ncbi:hypothetical protein BaRGS_00003697 [Batillaria attramentaria]|uniref:Uncharacterized protein n=1 Tax=Batillaria attramentaria TaxID=370345 RepID=A0ABD0M0C0_9CAEN
MPAQSETGADFSTLPLEFLCLAVCLGVLLAGCLPHWRVEEIHDPAKRDSSFLKYNFWRYCEGNQQKAKCGLMFLHAFKNPHILASQILLTVGLAATVVSVVLIPYNSGVGPRSGRQSVEIWSAICSAVAGE